MVWHYAIRHEETPFLAHPADFIGDNLGDVFGFQPARSVFATVKPFIISSEVLFVNLVLLIFAFCGLEFLLAFCLSSFTISAGSESIRLKVKKIG